jgi:hypothetical protein
MTTHTLLGTPAVDRFDKAYIESGTWKCVSSPTGAHWWREPKPGSDRFYCCFCGTVKDLPPFFVLPGDDATRMKAIEVIKVMQKE